VKARGLIKGVLIIIDLPIYQLKNPGVAPGFLAIKKILPNFIHGAIMPIFIPSLWCLKKVHQTNE
jgi:hypothetical protein